MQVREPVEASPFGCAAGRQGALYGQGVRAGRGRGEDRVCDEGLWAIWIAGGSRTTRRWEAVAGGIGGRAHLHGVADEACACRSIPPGAWACSAHLAIKRGAHVRAAKGVGLCQRGTLTTPACISASASSVTVLRQLASEIKQGLMATICSPNPNPGRRCRRCHS